MTNLPTTLYVTVEDPNTEDAYLNAQTDKADLVEMSQTKIVGVYKLVQRVELRGVAEVLVTTEVATWNP